MAIVLPFPRACRTLVGWNMETILKYLRKRGMMQSNYFVAEVFNFFVENLYLLGAYWVSGWSLCNLAAPPLIIFPFSSTGKYLLLLTYITSKSHSFHLKHHLSYPFLWYSFNSLSSVIIVSVGGSKELSSCISGWSFSMWYNNPFRTLSKSINVCKTYSTSLHSLSPQEASTHNWDIGLCEVLHNVFFHLHVNIHMQQILSIETFLL